MSIRVSGEKERREVSNWRRKPRLEGKKTGGVGERRAEPDISAENSNLGGETWWEEGGAAQTDSRFLFSRQENRKSEASPESRAGAGKQQDKEPTRWRGGDGDGLPPPAASVAGRASRPVAGGCQRRETGPPHPCPPPLLWQGAYLLWLGLKGPVPMTGRCGPGRFIQRRRDWQAALPETPHITHFTRGEKNLTVWPTFLEQTTRQTTPAAFPKQPQPQPWGSETLVWEELQLQAAVANPGQSRTAPRKHHTQKPGAKRKDGE